MLAPSVHIDQHTTQAPPTIYFLSFFYFALLFVPAYPLVSLIHSRDDVRIYIRFGSFEKLPGGGFISDVDSLYARLGFNLCV
jgi:hypothetical protein